MAWEKRFGRGEKSRRLTLPIAGTVFSAVAMTAAFAQSQSDNGGAPTRKRYLPNVPTSGNLILRKNFNVWVFAGPPFTPNALKRRPWLSR
ncbi:hypothetical protein ACVJGD_006453 [Bradyrhizobium sp. USDA 10063]